MSLYPYFATAQHRASVAAALLTPDDPSLPPEPPCACGHDRLYHNDRFSDRLADLAIGGGPCQQCPCGSHQAGA